MAFNNPESSIAGFPTSLTSTPAVMSSFLASKTFFQTTTSLDPAPSQTASTKADATSGAADTPTANTSKTSKDTSVKASSSTTHTSSSPTIGPEAASSTSNTLAGSGLTSLSSSITSPTGSTLSTSFTSAAAASATSGLPAVLSESQLCSSISCSPGKQAAVAVPVTLIGLGLIIAFIIFARRRRRSDSSSTVSNGEPRGSKWARHLRVFSFDAELLIGGRSSRATSVRSTPTARSHPSQTSLRSEQPSVRSLESPAPPYRDALAAGGVQMAMRPDSQLTAPPPYRADRLSHRPNSRLSAISRPATTASDPFADPEDGDEPISPVSHRSVVGRLSSAYQPVDADEISIVSSQGIGPSEAGSVRHAEVARRVSGARQG